MAYVLPGERVPVTVDDLTIEVQSVNAWAVAQAIASLSLAYIETPTTANLRAAYDFFVTEAQPTWAIVDHRGPVLPTGAGMMRLDPVLGLGLISAWAETYNAEPVPTAADKILPPGAMRDQVNRRLRKPRVVKAA